MRVHGIIPAIVTPMTTDEGVDYPRLCQVIDPQIAADMGRWRSHRQADGSRPDAGQGTGEENH
jgi:hypothetical protein